MFEEIGVLETCSGDSEGGAIRTRGGAVFVFRCGVGEGPGVRHFVDSAGGSADVAAVSSAPVAG